MTSPAPRCPRCRRDLTVVSTPGATSYSCDGCSGRAVTVAALNQFAPPDRVQKAWRATWRDAPEGDAACPFCARPMLTVAVEAGAAPLVLDSCRGCQAIWFDAGELAAFSPKRQSPRAKSQVDPRAARRALGESKFEDEALTGREEYRAGYVRGPRRGFPAGTPTFIVDLASFLSDFVAGSGPR